MESSVLCVYMVSSDSLAFIQVQGIAGPEGSRGLNCVMEVSGMNVCACECVWRWNKWEKVSMVSCVRLVLMQGLGTNGPTGQRCQLSPNNYLRTINDHLIQAVQVVYSLILFRNSQSLRYIAILFSEIAIEITFKFFWCWLFERLSPIYRFQPCLSLNTQIISNQNQKNLETKTNKSDPCFFSQ